MELNNYIGDLRIKELMSGSSKSEDDASDQLQIQKSKSQDVGKIKQATSWPSGLDSNAIQQRESKLWRQSRLYGLKARPRTSTLQHHS